MDNYFHTHRRIVQLLFLDKIKMKYQVISISLNSHNNWNKHCNTYIGTLCNNIEIIERLSNDEYDIIKILFIETVHLP
jgi:hypothetical protein